jgi:glycosidase
VPVSRDKLRLELVEEQTCGMRGREVVAFMDLTVYHALLALRRKQAALHSGSYRSLERSLEECLVYLLQCDNERLVVALTFSEEPQLLRIAEPEESHILFSTSLCRKDPRNRAELRLQGHGGCMLELTDGT